MSEQMYSRRDEDVITTRIAEINNILRRVRGKPEGLSQDAERLRAERRLLTDKLQEVRAVTRAPWVGKYRGRDKGCERMS